MSDAPTNPTRRRSVLAGLVVPCVGALAATFLPAKGALAARIERSLSFSHRVTGETTRAVYFADGRYLRDGIRSISRVLRDWRTDEVMEFDPKVLDIIWAVRRLVGHDGAIEVFSGYRSPATNARLRTQSRAVAKNSLHMYGKAVDLHLPGRKLSQVRRAALDLGAGGVGYYPRSGFVHLDSGPVRSWGQGARRR
jgi:uncharacterized protein YcbK (DUF882 family)